MQVSYLISTGATSRRKFRPTLRGVARANATAHSASSGCLIYKSSFHLLFYKANYRRNTTDKYKHLAV